MTNVRVEELQAFVPCIHTDTEIEQRTLRGGSDLRMPDEYQQNKGRIGRALEDTLPVHALPYTRSIRCSVTRIPQPTSETNALVKICS